MPSGGSQKPGVRGGGCLTQHQNQWQHNVVFSSLPAPAGSVGGVSVMLISHFILCCQKHFGGVWGLVVVQCVSGDGKGDSGRCTGPTRLFTPDISVQN